MGSRLRQKAGTRVLANGATRGTRVLAWMSMIDAVSQRGFYLLRSAFSASECDSMIAAWAAAAEANGRGVMRSANGALYGARNVLELWPDAAQARCQPALRAALAAVLGPDFGLVRALFFDKPPGESWALPWHKDLAIAVADNRAPSPHFVRPTTKYEVPHVEAPQWLLEQMLTARIHLDDVTDENGPLRVLAGSHRFGKGDGGAGESEERVLCERGDVLLMRPLLLHASGHSEADTRRHRRILHLEFSAVRELPDGYQWHTFVPAEHGPSPGAA